MTFAVDHRFEFAIVGLHDEVYGGKVEYGHWETEGKPALRLARSVAGAAGQYLFQHRNATDQEIELEATKHMSGGDRDRAEGALSEAGFVTDLKDEIIRVATRHAYRNLVHNVAHVEAVANLLLSRPGEEVKCSEVEAVITGAVKKFGDRNKW